MRNAIVIAIGQVLRIVAVALVACLAFPGWTTELIETSHDVWVECETLGQLCAPLFSLEVETGGILRVEFTNLELACSAARFHFLVDGFEIFVSDFLGWDGDPLMRPMTTGLIDLGPVVPGVHTLEIQGEGTEGGCNAGRLWVWAGLLTVTSSVPMDTDGDGIDESSPKLVEKFHGS